MKFVIVLLLYHFISIKADIMDDLLPSGLNCSVILGNLTYYRNRNITGLNWNCSGTPVAQTCPASLFSVPGSFACTIQCPASYYCPGNGSALVCPPGTYSLGGASLATCTPCPSNYYCINGIKKVCPSTWLSDVGSSSCTVPCPAGFYCTGVGYAIQCAIRGTYSLEGSSNCTTCEAGYYCPEYSKRLFCPPNTWSLPGSYANCSLPCPTGVVCPGNGKMSCTVCAPGIFTVKPCTADGDTICNATCPPGMFGAFYTKGFCKECEQGYYNDQYGMTSCSSCLPSTYANTTGNSVCKACPSGYNTNKFTGYIECRTVSPLIIVPNESSIYLSLIILTLVEFLIVYIITININSTTHETQNKRVYFFNFYFLSDFLPPLHFAELHIISRLLLSQYSRRCCSLSSWVLLYRQR